MRIDHNVTFSALSSQAGLILKCICSDVKLAWDQSHKVMFQTGSLVDAVTKSRARITAASDRQTASSRELRLRVGRTWLQPAQREKYSALPKYCRHLPIIPHHDARKPFSRRRCQARPPYLPGCTSLSAPCDPDYLDPNYGDTGYWAGSVELPQ